MKKGILSIFIAFIIALFFLTPFSLAKTDIDTNDSAEIKNIKTNKHAKKQVTEMESDSKILNIDVYDTLTYDDLVQISKDDDLNKELEAKVKYVLNHPVVDNTINTDEFKISKDPVIGEHIRVVCWNIERGMDLDRILEIFHDPDALIHELERTNPKSINKVKEEMNIIRSADVLMLTEVDAGMYRTNYRLIAEDFAKSIGYNYAYAVEFLEVDPSHLGLENYHWSEENLLFPGKDIVIDKNKYKGLHGTAILSKFPLKNVRIVRLPKVYDWYNGEKKRITRMERLRRGLSSKIFREAVIREIRYGSRNALIADIEVPGLDDPVTIVATHLENRTRPKNRKKQIKVILDKIEDNSNPVVIAGDFNTSVADAAPVGATKKSGSKLKRFFQHLEFYNIPINYALQPVMAIPNTMRKHTDPTIKSIPVLSSNKERGLFNAIKGFKDPEGNHFDFRATKGKFAGYGGTLANSNERNVKGFVPTFKFDRSVYLGKFKLDWLFVKPYCKKASAKGQSYKMAPHFGLTLFDLNFSFDDSFSDHAPITVKLPINEPKKLDKNEIKELKKEIKQYQKGKLKINNVEEAGEEEIIEENEGI